MRILIILSILLLQMGCSSVKVAREVTKAASSVKTSVKNLVNTEKNTNASINNSTSSNTEIELQILKNEKEEETKIVSNQKKIIKINFLGKSLDEIKSTFGDPNLSRIDGNTKILRFDQNSCKLFLFFNNNAKNKIVEYFEIIEENGNLIKNKDKIQNCYKDFDFS